MQIKTIKKENFPFIRLIKMKMSDNTLSSGGYRKILLMGVQTETILLEGNLAVPHKSKHSYPFVEKFRF